MSSQNNNENTKKDIFWDRLQQEAKTCTFLRVLKDKSQLDDDKFKKLNMRNAYLEACPKRNLQQDLNSGEFFYDNKKTGYRYATCHGEYIVTSHVFKKKIQKLWLIDAILATYKNYIPSIEWDNGDIANMVYYRFNQAKNSVAQATRDYVAAKEKLRRQKIQDLRQQTAVKRTIKEEEQYISLALSFPNTYHGIFRKSGESTRDWGKRCFEKRMLHLQHKSNTTEKNVSLNTLEKFSQWKIDNPNFFEYGEDLALKYKKFKCSEIFQYGRPKNCKQKVPVNQMWDLLVSLTQDKYSEALEDRPCYTELKIEFTWPDMVNGFKNYCSLGYCTSNHSWSRLQGNPRIDNILEINIAGAWNHVNNSKMIVLTTKNTVSKLVPKEFQACQNLIKNAPSYTLCNCRKMPLDFKINYITLKTINKTVTFMSSNQTTNQMPTSCMSRWWYQKATDTDMASIEDRIIKMKMERAKKRAQHIKNGKKQQKTTKNSTKSIRQKLQEAKKLLDDDLISSEDYELIKQKCISEM